MHAAGSNQLMSIEWHESVDFIREQKLWQASILSPHFFPPIHTQVDLHTCGYMLVDEHTQVAKEEESGTHFFF